MFKSRTFVLTALVVFLALSLKGVAGGPNNQGKIPITTSSQQALKYYLEGRNLADKIRYVESRQYFQKALQEDPDFAMAYLNMAITAPSASELFRNFNKAKVLIDGVSEGENILILGFEAGNINGNLARQENLYRKLTEIYPDDERALNILAGHYFIVQEYANAVENYKKVIEINPDFSQAYNQLGYAYRFMGEYEKAEKAFKNYINLIPNDPNPYDSYAELLMKMGKYDASIENYRKALNANPKFITSFLGIASNMNYQGNHKQARNELKVMYKQAENDALRRTALNAEAISYVDEGNFESALELLDESYKLAESAGDTSAMANDLISLGNVLLESGKPNNALANYEEAFLR
jgi:tetratricopeptide (TPR) repeat protein